jgi:DNA-binding NtrC family response regulator
MAKILVVDDELEVRRTFSTMLGRNGHEVVTAGDVQHGIEALQRARAERHPYEIALIDLRFENYLGTEHDKERAGMLVLDEALKDRFLEPIIMTAFPSVPTAREAVAKGVFRYLIKGDNERGKSMLMEAVDLALAHHECLVSLAEAIGRLDVLAKKPDDDSRIESQLCAKLAKESYTHIMRLRGRLV